MDNPESLSFARFLKFWRKNFGYSQEALSAEVGISTRHLSFLETGRSKPSRQLVIDFATFFKLSGRDTNNLLVAADFQPQDVNLFNQTPNENAYLGKMIDLNLNSVKDVPACAQDAYGNIVQCNKEWVMFHQYWQTGFIDGSCNNTFDLYLSDKGLRPYLKNWSHIACAVLLTLQQEILFTDDPDARAQLERLLEMPDLPDNWQRLGASMSYNHSFRLTLSKPGEPEQHFVAANNTIGATHYVSQPRRIITYLHRIDASFNSTDYGKDIVDHPLLARTH